MVLKKTGQIHAKTETAPPAYTMYKITSKGIKDLNVRPEVTKLPKENRGSKLSDIGLSNFFWLYLLRQRQQKQK